MSNLKIPVYYSQSEPPLIYETPDVPKREEIAGWNLPKEEQKFTRWKYPNDKDFDALTEKEQDDILDLVLKKRVDGDWFYNFGQPTYITGDHWFYLTFWRLDVGPPQYRVSDRDKFYFWDVCVKDPRCFGMVDMENRRGGKTEQANCIQYNYVSRTPFARGGTQSKTDTDAKKVFAKLVRAWKRLPGWLKPIDEGDSQPKTALRFFEPSKRDTKNKRKTYGVALDSYIDFETALEEAYDGEKLHRYTMDEAGKTVKANVADRWDIIKECFVQGDEIIGKALVTTTVEEMEKKGGKNFKKLYDESNMLERDENGQTKNGLYHYFKPAWYCLEGFIDQYGNSVHETPEKPVLSNTGKWITIGSIEYLERKRRGKDGKGLSSEKRKYPFTEEDAFGVILGAVWEDDVKQILEYADKEGLLLDKWRAVKLAEINEKIIANPVSKKDDTAVKILEDPLPNTKYSMGIDSASTDDETGADGGSKIAAVVTKGIGEGAVQMAPIMAYSERPSKKESAYQVIYLMAKYIVERGGKLEIIGENNAGGADCFHYLANRDLKPFMTQTPKEYANEQAGTKLGKFWLYVDGNVLPFLHGLGNRFIRLFGGGFRLPSVTTSLKSYGLRNEDEASAFLLSLFNFRSFDRPVKPKAPPPKNKIMMFDRNSGLYKEVEV